MQENKVQNFEMPGHSQCRRPSPRFFLRTFAVAPRFCLQMLCLMVILKNVSVLFAHMAGRQSSGTEVL